MANIRPKDLPAVTSPTAGDKLLIDGATARSITQENLFASKKLSDHAATTSAELKTVISDETGSGALVFATSPTLVTPALGTPSALVLTNASGLPLSGHVTQAAYTIVGNFTGSPAAPTASTIPALTHKTTPASADKIVIADSAASDALKYSTLAEAIGALASGVSSIAGNTGAFTLSGLLSNSTNDLRVLAATQAEQEAASSTTVAVTPGRQQFHPSAAKAWYKVTYTAGTPAVTVNYNVSSVTDTGVGRATINFTTAFSSANYAVAMSGAVGVDNDAYDQYVNMATGSFEHRHTETANTLTDPVSITGIAFGDQ